MNGLGHGIGDNLFGYYLEQTVIIMLIADGRRDMQTILRQRLLRPPN
jgi:hypothetical protein